ncbi:MAG: hypothetical protein ABI690_25480 [Chloroflexota bacterium]
MINRRALVGIKTLHTIIFLVESAAILYVLYCGLTRTYNGWLALAIGAVILESVVFVASGRRCPLTKWARQYGDASGNDWIADIFLPAWFAPKIPLLCGGLFGVGLIVLALNVLLSLR